MAFYPYSDMMGPASGIFPAGGQVQSKNVTGSTIAAGSVVAFDFGQSDADVTSLVPGHTTSGVEDSIWNCIVLPQSGAGGSGVKYGQFGLVPNAIAAGATGTVILCGIVPNVLVDGGTDNITKGGPVIANTAGKLKGVNATTTGDRICGYLMGTGTVSTATTATIFFCGVGAGFGNAGT